MATKNTVSYPTGLLIPVEKQSLFLVAFEDKLVSSFNVLPLFGPPTRENYCEVKFNYIRKKSFKPECHVSDLDQAAAFLSANMSILESKRSPKKRMKSKSCHISPQVITLDDESEANPIDLTDINQGDPEIIVLEDSFAHVGRITRQSSKNNSVVDLTDINESSKTPETRKETENYIEILNVKRYKPKKLPARSTPGNKSKVLNISSTRKNRKRDKKRKRSNRSSLTSTKKSNSSIKSDSLISLSSTDSLPRKKIKLQDISNIQSCCSCPLLQRSDLSENTLNYYGQISKVVGKTGGKKKKISNSKVCSVQHHLENNTQRRSKRLSRKISPMKIQLEPNNKRRVFTPENSFRHKNTSNHKRKFIQRPLTVQNSPWRSRNILQQGKSNLVRKIGETNAFNPNPFEVDLEGLRPIVIDGCNVAIGHGRGEFSPKGLKICVDYFATKGHTVIKVFLPQFRQEAFSAELLEELKVKCDVVFTPSQYINGQRRTPYDDRFIVQYATEFGGVIVSTDNYRDLSKENPRWQETIVKRLLMFTWVDDFLMFPVDPLGRRGPTLEEFLRF